MTGSVLDLNSASGYSHSVRENLTTAEVKAISEAILTPTTTTTSQQPTTTTTAMQPTLVALIDFNADPGNNTVTLIRHTASELINSGFNLHRSEVPDGAVLFKNTACLSSRNSPVLKLHSGIGLILWIIGKVMLFFYSGTVYPHTFL